MASTPCIWLFGFEEIVGNLAQMSSLYSFEIPGGASNVDENEVSFQGVSDVG